MILLLYVHTNCFSTFFLPNVFICSNVQTAREKLCDLSTVTDKCFIRHLMDCNNPLHCNLHFPSINKFVWLYSTWFSWDPKIHIYNIYFRTRSCSSHIKINEQKVKILVHSANCVKNFSSTLSEGAPKMFKLFHLLSVFLC